MKPYILNYSETIDYKETGIQIVDSTVLTENLENNDDDETIMSSTTQTFVLEPEDPDEFRAYESTYATESIEPSDDDEIALCS